MKRFRNEPRPGRSTIAAVTAITTAVNRTKERRSRGAENSSGSGSASTGSMYSTVKVGRSLIRTSQPRRVPGLSVVVRVNRRGRCEFAVADGATTSDLRGCDATTTGDGDANTDPRPGDPCSPALVDPAPARIVILLDNADQPGSRVRPGTLRIESWTRGSSRWWCCARRWRSGGRVRMDSRMRRCAGVSCVVVSMPDTVAPVGIGRARSRTGERPWSGARPSSTSTSKRTPARS